MGKVTYSVVGDGALLDGQDLIKNVVDEDLIIESRLLRWTIKPASQRYKVNTVTSLTLRCGLFLNLVDVVFS